MSASQLPGGECASILDSSVNKKNTAEFTCLNGLISTPLVEQYLFHNSQLPRPHVDRMSPEEKKNLKAHVPGDLYHNSDDRTAVATKLKSEDPAAAAEFKADPVHYQARQILRNNSNYPNNMIEDKEVVALKIHLEKFRAKLAREIELKVKSVLVLEFNILNLKDDLGNPLQTSSLDDLRIMATSKEHGSAVREAIEHLFQYPLWPAKGMRGAKHNRDALAKTLSEAANLVFITSGKSCIIKQIGDQLTQVKRKVLGKTGKNTKNTPLAPTTTRASIPWQTNNTFLTNIPPTHNQAFTPNSAVNYLKTSPPYNKSNFNEISGDDLVGFGTLVSDHFFASQDGIPTEPKNTPMVATLGEIFYSDDDDTNILNGPFETKDLQKSELAASQERNPKQLFERQVANLTYNNTTRKDIEAIVAHGVTQQNSLVTTANAPKTKSQKKKITKGQQKKPLETAMSKNADDPKQSRDHAEDPAPVQDQADHLCSDHQTKVSDLMCYASGDLGRYSGNVTFSKFVEISVCQGCKCGFGQVLKTSLSLHTCQQCYLALEEDSTRIKSAVWLCGKCQQTMMAKSGRRRKQTKLMDYSTPGGG
ncbi:unnamed protein product [Cylindrotheca closterium]|uniref:Uncharacterized protein n=1 Tax=Cylindrotheca closterium TaxID=2856 RepID=A0AAD2CHF5_9STRA|nr:unnamed protein product [Cylindrotheca closterium]